MAHVLLPPGEGGPKGRMRGALTRRFAAPSPGGRGTRDSIILGVLLVALVVLLPFELRAFPVFSNLQWLFIAIAAAGLPIIIRERRKLLSDRLVLAALVFTLVQCLAAFFAPEDFALNAAKGAARIAAGLVLLCTVLCIGNRQTLLQAWCGAAVAAALYGLADYSGFGASYLFRDAEFYFGDVLRLSGSFEYPNTAAAFFAMSLPIVWMTPKSQSTRLLMSVIVWSALILTYSRGAIAATVITLAIWAVAGRTRSAIQPIKLGALGVALYAALAIFQPFLVDRLQNVRFDRALAAEYRPEFNLLRLRPQESSELQIDVANVGAATWLPDGEQHVTIGYHWFDTQKKRLVPLAPIQTPMPRIVRPQESVLIQAPFQTPSEPGKYLLSWDLVQKDRGWFSRNGVVPGVVEVDVEAEADEWRGNTDVSRWMKPQVRKGPAADAAIGRFDLWTAAVRLAVHNPVLGVGPDNFRLLYGTPIGFNDWDTSVRANSLYLEILVGSGLAGLAAFIHMMTRARWTASAAAMSLAVFLVHGLVDVFLMTTPIYFAFWVLLGLAHEDRV